MRKKDSKSNSMDRSGNSYGRRAGFISCLTALLMISSLTHAQNVRVSGMVSDDQGNVLPGVSVVVKGTSIGTATGRDGNYSINVPQDGVLVFSFLGYIELEETVGTRTVINVTMREDAQDIDEVVVVGYGTQRKRDLTGAIVSVGSDKIKERSYSNVMQSLAGQLPGVQIQQVQGAPGFAPSIKIRGSSSINSGTNPLYVIDGVPMEDPSKTSGADDYKSMTANQNPMNFINPNDIESVEILKDASSAAIYGSRGANGVVLITTKQGKSGKTRIEASYELGISSVQRRIELMDAGEWMDFITTARNNTWASRMKANPNLTEADRPNSLVIPEEFSDPYWLNLIGNGTDWQDVLFRTGITHSVQLSASGGSEKTQFMVSGSYLHTEGVVDRNDYERFTVRSNIRHRVSDKIGLGVNVSLARTNSSDKGTAGKSDVVSLASQSNPIFPLYVETGSLGFLDPDSEWHTFQKYGFQLWHPYAITREIENKRIVNSSMVTGFVDWRIIPDLVFKTSLSASYDDTHFSSYQNDGQNYGWSGWVDAEARSLSSQNFNWIWENTLNYNRDFGHHNVTGLLGYTVQENRLDDSSIYSGDFPNDMVHTLNAGKPKSASTTASEWALISYLARATYSYQGKYLASAAIRADGCSRFGANNRWGYFPSASLGWRISEEAFLSGAANWLDNLKLRVSYGVTGNNQIDNYGAIGLLGYSQYPLGGSVDQGIYTTTFPDKDLKWEKTSQVNVGIDASFFRQRLNVTLDYYHSTTNDLLLSVPIPVTTGFASSLTNIGKMENKGLELNINSRNLTGNFTWTTDFNISGNRNKILRLGNNNAPFNYVNNTAIVRFEVGQPMANFYGYKLDGVILSEADMSKYPVWPGSEPGDPKVVDVNNDTKVDENDQTILGNAQPDFTWAMTNTFTFKNFDFSFMLNGSHGNEIFNQHSRFLKTFNGNRNAYKEVTNYWRSEANPGNGQIHKPRAEQNTVQSQSTSYWVEDGSFVRIKNIRLGYTLPQRLTRKIGIASAKIYVNMENVYVFSDYLNYDPEGSTFTTGAYVGLDYGAYPNPRTTTIGINFTF